MLGWSATHQRLDEGLAEHVEDVELREGGVVVVEGGEEQHVLAADLVLGVEATCRGARKNGSRNA
jgi:hypothetical protein